MNAIRSIPHKIILRHAEGWQGYDTARLHVSVPVNPVYDPRMRSILDWAQESFDNVILCVHDTIQRYNLMAGGLSSDAAYEAALKNGNAWLEENILSPDVFLDIVRWDKVLAHPQYAESQKRVDELYKSNQEFSAAVDHDLNTFAKRCRKRGETFESSRIALSRAFLLEEIAGYVPLYRETSAVDLHVGMRMKAMKILLDGVGNFNFLDNLMVSIKTFDLKDTEEKIRNIA